MTTVADLQAKLGLESSAYMKGMQSAQREAQTFARGVEQAASSASRSLSNIEKQTGGLSSIFKQATGSALGFAGAGSALGLIGGAFSKVKDSIIGTNATLQTSTLQFETLMGSADAAQAHVKDLFSFAAHTPFETQPVIDASRIMRTFGGDTLDTMANLTRIGNSAAVSNQSISEVGFWVGRAYSAIKNGQPFGEAAGRLQEMAILTGEERTKLEALQKQGASADKIFAVLTGAMDKFTGAMDKQAGTWAGLTSTFSDSLSVFGATAGKPIFEVISKGIAKLNTILGSDAVAGIAQKVADTIAAAFSKIGGVITVLTGYFQNFTTILKWIFGTTTEVGKWGAAWYALPKPIQLLLTLIDATVKSYGNLGYAIAQILGIDTSGLTGRWSAWGAVIDAIKQKISDLATAITSNLLPQADGITAKLAPAFQAVGDQIGPIVAALTLVTGGVVAFSATSALLSTVAAPLANVLSFVIQLNPWFIAIALAVAALGVAWSTNFLDIQGKTAALVDYITTNFGPTFQSLVDWFTTTFVPILVNIGNQIGPVLGQAFTLLGTAIQVATQFFKDHQLALVALLAVLAPLPGLIIAIALAWQNNWGNIQGIVNGISDALPGIAQGLQNIGSVAKTVFTGLAQPLIDEFTRTFDYIKSNWEDVKKGAKDTWDSIKVAATAVWNDIKDLIGGVVEWFNTNMDDIKTVVSHAWAGILLIWNANIKSLEIQIEIGVAIVKKIWEIWGQDILRTIQVIWELIEGTIRGSMQIIGGVIQVIVALLAGDWAGAWDGAKQIIEGFKTWIETVFLGVWDLLKVAIKAVADILYFVLSPAIGPVKGAFDALRQGVKDITDTFDNLKNAVPGIVGALGDLADAASKPLQLLHHSPPPLQEGIDDVAAAMHRIVPIMQGMGTNLKDVADAAGNASSVIDAFSKILEILPKLGKAAIPSGLAEQFTSLANVMHDAIASVFTQNITFNKIGLEHVGDVSDAASKAFDTFSKIVDFYQKIIDLKVAVHVENLVSMLRDMAAFTYQAIDAMTRWNTGWDKDILDLLGSVSDNASKVFDLFGKIAGILTTLTHVKIDIAAAGLVSLMRDMSALTFQAIQAMSDWNKGWDTDLLTQMSQVADTSSKIFDLFGKITGFITALQTFRVDIAAGGFVSILRDMAALSYQAIDAMSRWNGAWDGDLLTAVSASSEAVGKVITAFSSMTDLIVKLGSIDITLSMNALVSSFRDLAGLAYQAVDAMNSWNGSWSTDILANVSAASESIGKVIATLSAMADLVSKSVTAFNPGAVQASLQNLISVMLTIFDFFIAHMPDLTTRQQQIVNTVSPAIQAALGAIKDMLDLVLVFAQQITYKTKTATQELESTFTSFDLANQLIANLPAIKVAIQASISAMQDLIATYRDDMEQFAGHALDDTAAAAKNIQAIIGSLKDGIDLFNSIGDQVTQGLAGGSDSFTTYADKVQAARDKFNQTMQDLDQQATDLGSGAINSPHDITPEWEKKLAAIDEGRRKAQAELDRSLNSAQADLDKSQKAQTSKGTLQERIQKGIDTMRAVFDQVLQAMIDLTKEYNDKFAKESDSFTNMINAIGQIIGLVKSVFDQFGEIAGDEKKQAAVLAFVQNIPIIIGAFVNSVTEIVGLGLTDDQIQSFDKVLAAFARILGFVSNLLTFSDALSAESITKLQQLIASLPGIMHGFSDIITAINDSISSLGGIDIDDTFNKFDKILARLTSTFDNVKAFFDAFGGIVAQAQSFPQQASNFGHDFSSGIDQMISAIDDITTQIETLTQKIEAALAAALKALGECEQLGAALNALAACSGVSIGPAAQGVSTGTNAQGLFPRLPSNLLPDDSRLAGGGVTGMPGFYTVGEQGYELAWLPSGARVFDHSESERLLRGMNIGHMAQGGNVSKIIPPEIPNYPNDKGIRDLTESVDQAVKMAGEGSQQITIVNFNAPVLGTRKQIEDLVTNAINGAQSRAAGR